MAVNVAAVAPDGTATDAGTVSPAALLDSATVAPPVFDTVTVHMLVAPEPKVEGVQLTLVTTIPVTRAIDVVCVLAFNVAVTVAV